MLVSAWAALAAAGIAASPESDAPVSTSPPTQEDALHEARERFEKAAQPFTHSRAAFALEPPPSPLPRLRWDQEVACGELAPTPQVPSGYFRMQCDASAKQCLVAPNRVLDSSGVESEDELARLQPCAPMYDWAQLAARGYKFVPAIAEVQPGWIRDERGRAMQYNFDMNRRAWLGGAYAPVLSDLAPGHQRFRADLGLQVDVPSDDEKTLYRWHVLDSQFYLGTQTYDATLLRLDWSTARARPILFLTTFIGQPRRFDLTLDIGAWFEAVHLEYLRRGAETESFLTLGSANITTDIWHSKDMASFVRARAGAGGELDTTRHFTSLKPEVAVEGDFTLDRDGFHHIHFQAEGEKLLFDQAVAGRNLDPQRLHLSGGYEVILFAVNDQPVTLVLDAKGTYRDDFVTVGPGWEWSAEAGLRFSLWAPARRSAPLQAQK